MRMSFRRTRCTMGMPLSTMRVTFGVMWMPLARPMGMTLPNATPVNVSHRRFEILDAELQLSLSFFDCGDSFFGLGRAASRFLLRHSCYPLFL